MSNEKSLLPKGFGMPFVKVADAKGKVIVDPKSNLPIGTFVTNFEYNYREEKDDECDIVITTENENLVDIPQFREQQYLTLQWGWIYSDSSYIPSPVRRVMIRDVKLRFSVQGIVLTLKCTDGFSLVKSQQINKNKDDNFINWIKEAITGNYGFKCYIHDAKKVEASRNYEFMGSPLMSGGGYNPLAGPDIVNGRLSGLKEVEADKFFKTRTFVQLGKTPYTVLKDGVKFIPNGPYHIDGRDDGVSIHPTNFNQPPIASFTWRDETGEMLSFTINTRKKAKYTDVVNKSKINGETKQIDTGVTQTDGGNPNLNVDGITGETRPATYESMIDGITGAAVGLPTDQYQDEASVRAYLEKDQNILKEEAPKYLEKVIEQYKEAENDPFKLSQIDITQYTVKVKAKVKETVNPEDFGSNEYQTSSPGYQRTTGWDSIKRDKTIQIVPKADGTKYTIWDNPEIVREKELEIKLSAKDLLGYAGDADSSKILAFNKVNDALQKQVEAQLVTVGQPGLESSKIITINNVSKKYSGDWYTKEVSHKIDSSGGYITTFELIKKTAANGTIIQSNTQSNTQALAKKIQKIANDLTDADIAKAQAIKSEQERILNQYEDAGNIYVIMDEEGTSSVTVASETDWVSLNKTTQTPNINRNDRIIRDKISKK